MRGIWLFSISSWGLHFALLSHAQNTIVQRNAAEMNHLLQLWSQMKAKQQKFIALAPPAWCLFRIRGQNEKHQGTVTETGEQWCRKVKGNETNSQARCSCRGLGVLGRASSNTAPGGAENMRVPTTAKAGKASFWKGCSYFSVLRKVFFTKRPSGWICQPGGGFFRRNGCS